MGLTGVQPIMDAITTKLQTDMPAKVAALNAEYADAYALADVAHASYIDHVVDPFALSCEWPAIVLLDGGDRREPEESNFATHVMTYTVVVDILVRGQDADELTAKLRRYKRAVKEILSARHSLAPACTNCTYDSGGGAELIDPSSGDYLQDKACRFLITTAEALS